MVIVLYAVCYQRVPCLFRPLPSTPGSALPKRPGLVPLSHPIQAQPCLVSLTFEVREQQIVLPARTGQGGAEVVAWGGDGPLDPRMPGVRQFCRLGTRLGLGWAWLCQVGVPGRTMHCRMSPYLSDGLSKAVSFRGPGHTGLATLRGKQEKGIGRYSPS